VWRIFCSFFFSLLPVAPSLCSSNSGCDLLLNSLAHASASPPLRPLLFFPLSRITGNHRGLIRKYGLYVSRRCFREVYADLGFKKLN
jgi:hypothetical protein